MNDGLNSGCAYPHLRESLVDRQGRRDAIDTSGVQLNAASLAELHSLVTEGSVEQFLCLQRAVQAGRADHPCVAVSAAEEELPWPPPTD